MNLSYVQGYAGSIIAFINSILVPVLLAIAVLTFIWGIYSYFFIGANSEEKRKTGRDFLLWSIIGFVAIFSLWGLVGLVGNTFGLSPGGTAPAPPLFNTP